MIIVYKYIYIYIYIHIYIYIYASIIIMIIGAEPSCQSAYIKPRPLELRKAPSE